MNSIVTALIATAVLGAPTFTAGHARECAARPQGRAAQPPLPRTPQPTQAPAREERERTSATTPASRPASAGERRPAPTRNVKVDVTITGSDRIGSADEEGRVGHPRRWASGSVRSMTSVPLVSGRCPIANCR